MENFSIFTFDYSFLIYIYQDTMPDFRTFFPSTFYFLYKISKFTNARKTALSIDSHYVCVS